MPMNKMLLALLFHCIS